MSITSKPYIRETDGAMMIETSSMNWVNLTMAHKYDLLTPTQKRLYPAHMDSQSARDARKTQMMLEADIYSE